MLDIRPNNSIYVNNLNERIKKEELRRSLYSIFSQFGSVVDVVALKTAKMRGQAFIAFRDINSATNALRSMQGFPFYDKPMRIQYAKSDSNAIAKIKGTYVERSALGKHALEAAEAKKSKKKAKEPGKGNPLLQGLIPGVTSGSLVQSMVANSLPQSKQTVSMTPTITVTSEQPPNAILFLTNLPVETNELMLSLLFNHLYVDISATDGYIVNVGGYAYIVKMLKAPKIRFTGFKEVRLVPGRSDIAFVEFENEVHSGAAKDALQGFKITPTHAMKITFAKK